MKYRWFSNSLFRSLVILLCFSPALFCLAYVLFVCFPLQFYHVLLTCVREAAIKESTQHTGCCQSVHYSVHDVYTWIQTAPNTTKHGKARTVWLILGMHCNNCSYNHTRRSFPSLFLNDGLLVPDNNNQIRYGDHILFYSLCVLHQHHLQHLFGVIILCINPSQIYTSIHGNVCKVTFYRDLSSWSK